MEHMAVYWETSNGRAGTVESGNIAQIEKRLDRMTQAHKNKLGIGLVGYQGFASFEDAIKSAVHFEHYPITY